MTRAKFTGRPYLSRKGVYYAHPLKWWIRTDWSGWWEILPPGGHKAVKRFEPHTYWTHVVPYVRALLTEGTTDGDTQSGNERAVVDRIIEESDQAIRDGLTIWDGQSGY